MTSQDARRPTPEELLRKVQADERKESRGRLKVFLGYASRVGKSFRMFDEGRRRKERGQDVVVGALQSGSAPDIAEIQSRLELIPAISSSHGGREYQVIDVPALLRRQPQVCLIDGLAYDNPPGSRNPQRWQDVGELLDNGISVITTVNLQHIREQQDQVQRITGRRALNSISSEFLKDADEIELVDAPPDTRSLAELRELALLLAADVVDHQLQAYLDSHGVAARWGAQERILVCLTPHSNASDMLRSGQRNRLRFHGVLLAAYMEQPDLRPADRERLERHIALAREMGAEIHTLQGSDFVKTILDFASEQRVTQLFLGHTERTARSWLSRSPLDRLIDGADGFDVRLFPHEESA